MKNQYRFTTPPARLRRARLDNLALVPGNMLPYKDAWQELANKLPRDGVLIVLPKDNAAQKQALLTVARLLAAEGHQVRVVPAEEVSRSQPYVQPRLEF